MMTRDERRKRLDRKLALYSAMGPILGATASMYSGLLKPKQIIDKMGATLLDRFAIEAEGVDPEKDDAKAVAKFLDLRTPPTGKSSIELVIWWAEADAKMRYIHADAMMRERAKHNLAS